MLPQMDQSWPVAERSIDCSLSEALRNGILVVSSAVQRCLFGKYDLGERVELSIKQKCWLGSVHAEEEFRNHNK